MPETADHDGGMNATPLWVKVVAIVAVLLLVVVIVLLLTGRGGGHGPGRHLDRGNDPPREGLRPA